MNFKSSFHFSLFNPPFMLECFSAEFAPWQDETTVVIAAQIDGRRAALVRDAIERITLVVSSTLKCCTSSFILRRHHRHNPLRGVCVRIPMGS